MVLNYILCFGAPGLIAQFSKCDFWNLGNLGNLGDFGDRNIM